MTGAALDAERITLSALTLGTEVSFADRVAAAAAAGFRGLGLRAQDYAAARGAGWDDAAMQGALDRAGLELTEVELLAGWAAEDDTPSHAENEATVIHVARTFGAHHVNAALFQTLPLDLVVERFAALCDRAPDVRVALEFMPFGGLPDLATSWEVVRRAERPNAGLLLDAWHWARAGTTPSALAAVPPERVFGVQLSDVGERPLADRRQETLHHRRVPGEGCGDVAGFVDVLRAAGVTAPVSVEVMSDELLARGSRAAAAAVMAGARSVLR